MSRVLILKVSNSRTLSVCSNNLSLSFSAVSRMCLCFCEAKSPVNFINKVGVGVALVYFRVPAASPNATTFGGARRCRRAENGGT